MCPIPGKVTGRLNIVQMSDYTPLSLLFPLYLSIEPNCKLQLQVVLSMAISMTYSEYLHLIHLTFSVFSIVFIAII